MIKHIVMFRMTADKNTQADKFKQDIERLKAELEALPPKIQEIKNYEVGINIKDAPTAFDLVLVSEFENQQKLDQYIKHPDHQSIIDLVKAVSSERVVVDYEL